MSKWQKVEKGSAGICQKDCIYPTLVMCGFFPQPTIIIYPDLYHSSGRTNRLELFSDVWRRFWEGELLRERLMWRAGSGNGQGQVRASHRGIHECCYTGGSCRQAPSPTCRRSGLHRHSWSVKESRERKLERKHKWDSDIQFFSRLPRHQLSRMLLEKNQFQYEEIMATTTHFPVQRPWNPE